MAPPFDKFIECSTLEEISNWIVDHSDAFYANGLKNRNLPYHEPTWKITTAYITLGSRLPTFQSLTVYLTLGGYEGYDVSGQDYFKNTGMLVFPRLPLIDQPFLAILQADLWTNFFVRAVLTDD